MKLWGKLNVGARIQILVCALLVLLITGQLVLFLGNAETGFSHIGEEVQASSSVITEQMGVVSGNVQAALQASALEALQGKGTSLARLLAQQCPVAILTFDTDPLDIACRQACQDSDVLLAYVANTDGEALTEFTNGEAPEMLAHVAEAEDLATVELAQKLRGHAEVLGVEASITQDGESLGKVHILLSTRGARAASSGGLATLERELSNQLDSLSASVQAEAEESLDGALMAGILAGLGMMVIGAIVVTFVARSIARPLRGAVSVLERVAEGDLTSTMTVRGEDEIARMALALNHAVERMSGALTEIGVDVQTLRDASARLDTASGEMTRSSRDTAETADQVSNAATNMNEQLSASAAATEEFVSCVGEIANSAGVASNSSREGVEIAGRAHDLVGNLAQSSQEIGGVIKLISSIADQTNLLALNASIEAARAGEAGKGFTVVANEVKELALQTTRGAGDISTKIVGIQQAITDVSEAIGQVVESIGEIEGVSSTIAAAVEEQSATSNEISSHLQTVAQLTQQITQNLTTVAQNTDTTTRVSESTNEEAKEVRRVADVLSSVITRFKVSA